MPTVSMILISFFPSFSPVLAQSVVYTPFAKNTGLRLRWNRHLALTHMVGIDLADLNPNNYSNTAYFTQGMVSDKAREARQAALPFNYMAEETGSLGVTGGGTTPAPIIIPALLNKQI